MPTSDLQALNLRALTGDREAAAALEEDPRTPASPSAQLAILLCTAPSKDAWRHACSLIAASPTSTVPALLPAARRWPARVRRGRCDFSLGTGQATNSGDMAEALAALIRTGERCPSLSLLGWAVVTIAYPEHTPRDLPPRPLGGFLDGLSMMQHRETMRAVVHACARHLDPGFTASNRVSSKSKDRYWNNFSERIRVGRKQQGILWTWEETEHCADESARGRWTTHGLAEDTGMHAERYQRGRRAYSFSVRGPTPAVLDVIALLGAICRAEETMTAQDILRLLQQ